MTEDYAEADDDPDAGCPVAAWLADWDERPTLWPIGFALALALALILRRC